uniref:Uncharacterized protein n=1 Tax=Rhizophagus irregularis (strain DAOM 181602 / DAOM 197198 / MUCL 43194) TaxID=747089 RepID=U9T272_RHIID
MHFDFLFFLLLKRNTSWHFAFSLLFLQSVSFLDLDAIFEGILFSLKLGFSGFQLL